jgi:CRP-like cAMP-binding protein
MQEDSFKKLRYFFAGYKKLFLPPRSIFVRPTDKQEFVYLIESGMVRLFCINEKGEEVSITLFGCGAVLPLMSVLGNTQSAYYLESIEPTKLLRAPTQEVLAYIKQDPEILYLLLQNFSSGIGQLMAFFGRIRQSSCHTGIYGR